MEGQPTKFQISHPDLEFYGNLPLSEHMLILSEICSLELLFHQDDPI